MKKLVLLIVLTLVFFYFAGLDVKAQEFGSIKGIVRDSNELILPGVSVTLTGSKIAPMSAISSEGGNFRFLNLPVANDYTLKLELKGFKTLIREKLIVSFGKDLNFDLVLEQSPIKEEVVVVGKAPIIDTKKAQVGITVGEDMIMRLPTARNPWVIMALIPGMLIDRQDVGGAEGGQQSSYYGLGSSSDDNTWNIDGANITDNSALGAAPSYVNIASYEEIQINYGNNDIRSQTGGVQINLVSRRGGNKYSGMFYLDAADRNWQSDNVPQALKDVGYTAAGINKVYLYGGNFGGPVIKDKLWFFGSWGVQDIDKLALTGLSDKTWLSSGYTRLDAQLTKSTRANFLLEYDNKQKWGRASYGYTEQAPDTLWNQTGPGYLWKGEIEQMFGNLYLAGKVIYTNGGFALIPSKGHRTSDGSGAYTTNLNYPQFYMTGNPDDYGTDRNQLNLSFNGVLFKEKLLGGDHEFKFGVDYVSATTTTYDLYEGNVILNYEGPDSTMPTGEWWMAQLLRDNLVNDGFNRFSFYLQDTITYGRLAINLGLRYDQEKSMVKNLNIPASPWLSSYMPAVKLDKYDPGVAWKVLSPRLSLSYDLFGNGKDIIKFSIARYGSQSGNSMADFINPVGASEIDVLWQDLNHDGRVTADELFGYNWDAGTLEDPNNPAYWISSNNVNPENPSAIAALNKFDPNYNSPLLDEISLSYEKELVTDFAARLEFFYKKYHRQNWTQAMMLDERLETADNYYKAGTDSTTGYDYYGRYEYFPYEYRTNHKKAYDRYLGAQIVLTKRLSNRWMTNASFTISDWKRFYKGEFLGHIYDVILGTYPYVLEEGLNNQQYFDGGVVAPESSGSGIRGVFVNSRWMFKLSGLYQLPFGVTFSGVFDIREGYVNPTNVLINLPGIGNKRIYGNPDGSAGKFGDQRLPAFWTLNFRIEKSFQVSEGTSVALTADAFNITNSAHSLKKENRITSSNFNQDLTILSPRVFRFGVRFNF